MKCRLVFQFGPHKGQQCSNTAGDTGFCKRHVTPWSRGSTLYSQTQRAKTAAREKQPAGKKR